LIDLANTFTYFPAQKLNRIPRIGLTKNTCKYQKKVYQIIVECFKIHFKISFAQNTVRRLIHIFKSLIIAKLARFWIDSQLGICQQSISLGDPATRHVRIFRNVTSGILVRHAVTGQIWISILCMIFLIVIKHVDIGSFILMARRCVPELPIQIIGEQR
jgi:hypothetical protein